MVILAGWTSFAMEVDGPPRKQNILLSEAKLLFTMLFTSENVKIFVENYRI